MNRFQNSHLSAWKKKRRLRHKILNSKFLNLIFCVFFFVNLFKLPFNLNFMEIMLKMHTAYIHNAIMHFFLCITLPSGGNFTTHVLSQHSQQHTTTTL